MAGLLFIISFDAAVRALRGQLKSSSVFACADDVFLVLKKIEELATAMLIFQMLEKAACLKLSPSKCEIVPLWAECTEAIVTIVRAELRRIAPSFCESTVAGATIFLGIPIGPASTSEGAWKPVINKMSATVRSILISGAHVSLSCALFVRRVLPICTYTAQFFPPSPVFNRMEIVWLSQLWRAPGLFFSRSMAANLPVLAKTEMKLPSLISWCVHVRAAKRTFAPLVRYAAPLVQLAEEVLPLVRLHAGHTSPSYWCSEAFALRMHRDIPTSVPLKCAEHDIARKYLNHDFCGSIQRELYRKFLLARFPVASALSEVWCRIQKAFGGCPPFDLDAHNEFIRAQTPHTVQCYLRSAMNGWPTSRRLHLTAVAPCRFNCGKGSDAGEHYLVCEVLHATIGEQGIFYCAQPCLWLAVAYSTYCGAGHVNSQCGLFELARAACLLHCKRAHKS